MLIKKVTINPYVKWKIYNKHNVTTEEIEDVLMKNKPFFRKVGGKQYSAIGVWNRYLIIFFKYNHKTKEAKITSAYPPSKKGIKSYKKK